MEYQYKTTICGVVAIGPDNVIGRKNQLPWHSTQDLYHFKTLTNTWPCIFGRNTFDGLTKKPLPNRINIVCSSSFDNKYNAGIFYFNNIETAIKQCKHFEKIFICGGSALYKYALEKGLIDVMYITKIYSDTVAQEIKRQPQSFVRFPIDDTIFFNGLQWSVEPITYPNNVLPHESSDIVCKFFKSTRINTTR